MFILNLCFMKFGFGLHAGSVVLVDFLHVLSEIQLSVKVRFISAPNPFHIDTWSLLQQLQLCYPILGCTWPWYVCFEVVHVCQ